MFVLLENRTCVNYAAVVVLLLRVRVSEQGKTREMRLGERN